MGGSKEHIVMLPFMAQGPLNARYLRAAMAQNPNEIHLHELELNSIEHDLPPNTENTEALPLHQIVNLFHSSTSLQLPFRALIQDISAADGTPPLCVISDVFMGWADEVARSLGTVNVTFTTGGAYGTAAYVSLWQHLPHRKCENEDGYFTLPGFPDSCVFHVTQLHRFLRAADGCDSWSRFFQPQIGQSLNSFGWLCNTAEAIEPFGLDVLRKYTGRPVWSVGPLLPPSMLSKRRGDDDCRLIGKHTGREPGFSAEKCLHWLDSHSRNSVLYISFGSQNTIGLSQMMALATGLEESKQPFVWVIRPPVGFNPRGEFKSGEWLPCGFEERVARSNRGLVVHGWAPQLEILCHESTGAFMSHCGWNSVMESLSQGVPIIGWPLAAEQGYNAKMLVEEMGVCVEIARGVEGSISKDEVKRVIERVMGGGEEAGEMKRKSDEIGELIRGAVSEEGSSCREMDDFVSALLTNKTKQRTGV